GRLLRRLGLGIGLLLEVGHGHILHHVKRREKKCRLVEITKVATTRRYPLHLAPRRGGLLVQKHFAVLRRFTQPQQTQQKMVSTPLASRKKADPRLRKAQGTRLYRPKAAATGATDAGG